MANEDQTKVCAQCEQVKVLTTQFHRSKSSKDGQMKMCKDCYAQNKQDNTRRRQQEIEKQIAEEARQAEIQRQKQTAFLAAWFEDHGLKDAMANRR